MFVANKKHQSNSHIKRYFVETYNSHFSGFGETSKTQKCRQKIRQTGTTDTAEHCMNVFLTNKNCGGEIHCEDQFQASCTSLRNQYEAIEQVGTAIDI